MNINSYSKNELENISKLLKKYRSLRKNVGKKALEMTLRDLSGSKRILVEHFPSMNSEEAKKEAKVIYSKFFWIDLGISDIETKENTMLAWWIRLFLWDDMLDISFENIKNTIRKI